MPEETLYRANPDFSENRCGTLLMSGSACALEQKSPRHLCAGSSHGALGAIADGEYIDTLISLLRFSGTPFREPVAPPEVGRHTDIVLQEILGLASAEIQELRKSGAVT
jgi:crotonobetainyl-CoA:carnitine CoA-transferase CaiB-like acyl-CoA transferase